MLYDRYGVVISAVNGDTDYEYYNPFFKIEYETTGECLFKASKDIAPTHNRITIDNQTNSYVDAYNQGFMEYQKANRLGNKQLFINARYEENFDELINIGDYYNDSIIYQTQYQFYNNHIEVNATATKDYILRNYFTGVKAKIRSWKIVDGNEAFIRHDLNKYYLEFSKKRKNESIDLYYRDAYYFLTPLYTYEINPLRYCAIITTDRLGNEYPYSTYSDKYYSVDLSSRIIGNSIVFTFALEDNYQAGVSYDTSKFTVSRMEIIDNSVSGGIPLMPLRYVDDNGEFEDIYYVFSDNVKINTTDGLLELVNGYDCEGIIVTDVFTDIYQKPAIEENEFSEGAMFSYSGKLYKDNKEITEISTQFEFCSDTHDIVFTKKFLELQKSMNLEVTSTQSSSSQVVRMTGMQVFFDDDLGQYYGIVNYTVPAALGTVTLGSWNRPQFDDDWYFDWQTENVSYYSGTRRITWSCYFNRDTVQTQAKAEEIAQSFNRESYVDVTINFSNTQILNLYTPNLKLYVKDNSDFDFKQLSLTDATLIGNSANILITDHSNSVAHIILSVDASIDVENSVFYITNTDSNNVESILLAISGTTEVYLNILLSRDYNVYDDNRNVSGEI